MIHKTSLRFQCTALRSGTAVSASRLDFIIRRTSYKRRASNRYEGESISRGLFEIGRDCIKSMDCLRLNAVKALLGSPSRTITTAFGSRTKLDVARIQLIPAPIFCDGSH